MQPLASSGENLGIRMVVSNVAIGPSQYLCTAYPQDKESQREQGQGQGVGQTQGAMAARVEGYNGGAEIIRHGMEVPCAS
jgi:hypothetical protein